MRFRTGLFSFIFLMIHQPTGASEVDLLPTLDHYLDARSAEFDQISESRKAELELLADYISQRLSADQTVALTFICTHNSRRSHLAQLWAAAAAIRYGIDGVETFSGGTEVTAFNPRAVAALRRCGMEISAVDPQADNPRYRVRLTVADQPSVECFSKRFDESPNPTTGFCAVMTCSHADATCPTVHGSELRLAIAYEDPKVGDGTPQEADLYDIRSKQIAREMMYALSRVTPLNGRR